MPTTPRRSTIPGVGQADDTRGADGADGTAWRAPGLAPPDYPLRRLVRPESRMLVVKAGRWPGRPWYERGRSDAEIAAFEAGYRPNRRRATNTYA